MYEIIYFSSASCDLPHDDIHDILTTARRFNKRDAITGCIISHNREIIQILSPFPK